MKIVLGILQWGIAIVAIAGTIALFAWMALLFFRKGPKDDSSRNRH